MGRTTIGKITILFIVCAVFLVFLGKLLVYRPDSNFVLYLYGILVTFVLWMYFIITFSKYRDPYFESLKIPDAQRKKYTVSCMVAVRNEEEIIEDCIKSLINQTYDNREIIVVNDASTDRTGEILEKMAKKGITVLHLKRNLGKKRALARAMLRAKGEIFVFTDSDSVLAHDAVEKLVGVFNADPMIGAVSGHCRALNGDTNILTKIQDSWYEGQFSVRKAFESIFGAVTCVSGPLAAFRKETIFNFIPAWENDQFLGEEFKFATDRTLTGFVLGNQYVGESLKKKYRDSPFLRVDYPLHPWKIVYSKAARAWTTVPDTLSRLVRQQVRWKKSFIRNLFFTGKFYWRKPFLPALVYYLHVVFVLAGPFIAFRHLIYLPVHGNALGAFLYIAGIVFVGFMFGLAYKVENRESHKWVYRPFMSLLSTLFLSWLIFYSILTIRKMTWSRG